MTVTWPTDVVYDIENFPNWYSVAITPLSEAHTDMWSYEISARCDHSVQLYQAFTGSFFRRMYGFNNLNYDWPVCMAFIEWFEAGARGGWRGAIEATYRKTQEIFAAGDGWSHRVAHWKARRTQVDLFLLHHMDNPSRRTSLKTLQFNMRARSVEDMPVTPGVDIPVGMEDVVLAYGAHDTAETKRFAHHSQKMIAFREQLIAAGTFDDQCLSWNDTKIGKQMLIKRLEARKPGICYDGRKPRQTWRPQLRLADVILPYARFDAPELAGTLQQLKDTTLVTGLNGQLQTKGVLEGLHVVHNGFRFDLGTGGIHGSVTRQVFQATADWPIVDLDVASYYPRIAIVNRIAPAHLGAIFVEEYTSIYDRRMALKRLADKTAQQLAEIDGLKLGGNGVYGDSNNIYGPFYDPAYTMAITVNGQLLLLMLAEVLMRIPTLRLIQINTDGLTFQIHQQHLQTVQDVMAWWQAGTALELEEGRYARMWVRDVNSYVAQDPAGKLKKLKGAYDYELKVGDQHAWHKDHSSLVIQRAAVAAMVEGIDVSSFVERHMQRDPWDFLLRQRSRGQDFLQLGDGTRLPQTVRYYIADGHTGQRLLKNMPPLKGKTEWRRNGVHAEGQAVAMGGRGDEAWCCSDCGQQFQRKADFEIHNQTEHCWKIKTCNVFDGDLSGIDLRYYAQEAEKLVIDMPA